MDQPSKANTEPGSRQEGNRRWLTAAISLVLLLGTVTVYWPVRSYDFLNYDDPYYVTANPHVQSGLRWGNVVWAFTSVHASNWHPLTWLSHALDCQLFGQHAGAHHLVNVGFHAANALLLFLILLRLTRAVWRSACVAALFALHPLHVESVAWVSERKDVLSTLFFLLTLWAYVEYADRAEARGPKADRNPKSESQTQQATGNTQHALSVVGPQARTGPLLYYFLALALFGLGLMSKPMLVTLPCVLLLLDYWPLARLHSGTAGRLVWEKLPFFALSAVVSVVTCFAQQQEGAMVSLEQLPLVVRSGNALISYVRYSAKLLWPQDLSVLYLHPHDWPGWQILASALLLAGVLAGVLWRSRRQPYLATGWWWFLGTLVPVIGLVQVGIQSMADRYTYIPSIGFFLMLVWGGGELVGRWRWRVATSALVVLTALAACAYGTVRQLHCWANSETLFRQALQVNPANYRASNNLGLYLFEHGRIDEAIAYYRQAVQLAPEFDDALDNLGCALVEKQEFSEALQCYEASLRSQPRNPQTHNNLGVLLAQQGRLQEACEQFDAAFRLNPSTPGIHSNLGRALAAQKKYTEAIAQYEAALQLWPGDVAARYNLGKVLSEAGKLDEAMLQYQTVLRSDPGHLDARNQHGVALARQGRLQEAMAQFQQVVQANTNHAGAHNNFAKALAAQHQFPEAIEQYREVLRLRPNDTQARHDLARTLLDARQLDRAIEHYGQLLQQTNSAELHYELGRALSGKQQWTEAEHEFGQTLKLDPNAAEAHNQLGKLAQLQSHTAEALEHWRQAARLAPDWPAPLNNLAWVLATDPHPERRNGPEALRLAERAVALAGTNDVSLLDTLAAAYAEAGRFPEAVSTALKAEALLPAPSPPHLKALLESRLALYRSHQPFREAPAAQ
jgi:protein O-mannosyl-transferase